MAETKPDCLNSDLALPGILLNARNQRTKGMPEGSRDKRVDDDDKQKGYKDKTSKDTKAKNGAKTCGHRKY